MDIKKKKKVIKKTRPQRVYPTRRGQIFNSQYGENY